MRSERITRTPKQNPLRVRASDPAEARRPAFLAPRGPATSSGRSSAAAAAVPARRHRIDLVPPAAFPWLGIQGRRTRDGLAVLRPRAAGRPSADLLARRLRRTRPAGSARRRAGARGAAPAGRGSPPIRLGPGMRWRAEPSGGRGPVLAGGPSEARPKPEAPLGRPSRWASAVAASPPGRAERGAPVPDLEPRPAAPEAEADGRRRAGKSGSARLIAESTSPGADSARPRSLSVGPATRPCRPTCPRRLPAIGPSPRLRPRMPQSPARPPASARPLPSRGRAPDPPARTLPAVRTFRQPLPRDVPGADAPGIATPSYNLHRAPRPAMRRACRPPRLGVRPAPRPSRIRRDPRIGHGAGRWRSAAHRRRVSAK